MSESFQEISQDFIPLEGVSLQIKTSEAYVGSSVVTPDPNSGVLLEGFTVQVSENGLLSEPLSASALQNKEENLPIVPDLSGIVLIPANNYSQTQILAAEKAQTNKGNEEILELEGSSLLVENESQADLPKLETASIVNNN